MNSTPPEPPRRPTDLYRFYDSQGTLLYVGISLGAAQRASQHRADKEWWPQVARMDVQHLGNVTRPEAEAIERQAIVDERPKHNVVHNRCTAPARRNALAWECHICGGPIKGEGYIELPDSERRRAEAERDIARWRVIHDECDDDDPPFHWLDITRYRTIEDLRRLDRHMEEKRWVDRTDWCFIVNGALRRAGA